MAHIILWRHANLVMLPVGENCLVHLNGGRLRVAEFSTDRNGNHIVAMAIEPGLIGLQVQP